MTNDERFIAFARPALSWLVRPAFQLHPGSAWREGLMAAASLLARLLLVVYRARERVLVIMGSSRGESATRNDKDGL